MTATHRLCPRRSHEPKASRDRIAQCCGGQPPLRIRSKTTTLVRRNPGEILRSRLASQPLLVDPPRFLRAGLTVLFRIVRKSCRCRCDNAHSCRLDAITAYACPSHSRKSDPDPDPHLPSNLTTFREPGKKTQINKSLLIHCFLHLRIDRPV